MKKLFLLATLAFATPAFAQQTQEFSLKVTNDELTVIGKALGKLPFDEVASIIQKLRSQVVEQSKPAEVPKGETKPEEKK